MGSEKVVEKLDAEIAALEKAQGFGDAGRAQEDVSADSPPTTDGESKKQVSAETEPPVVMPTSDAHKISVAKAVEEPTDTKRIDYKKRWKNFKKYHDAEKYKDNQIKAEAFQRISELTKENGVLREQIGKLSLAQKPSARDLVSKEELDIIGDEGISSIDKITRRAIKEAVDPLKEELAKARTASDASVENAMNAAKLEAHTIFLRQLESIVPDFKTLDTEVGFEKFLKGIDSASGALRFDLFKNAQRIGDVGRVAGFFKEYKKGKRPTVAETLSRKITPQNIGSAPPEQAAVIGGGNKPFYKMSDYSRFMDDLAKGKKYQGRHKEAEAIEKEFDLAFMEGRVVNQ